MYQRTVIMDYSSYQYEQVYESIGKYSLEDVQKFRWKRFNFSPSQKDKVVYVDHDYFREFRFPARKEKLQPILHWVPSEFSRLGYNYAEFQGIVHNWLRLKDEYKKYIEQKKKRIGFRNPIIGVHIRRGDKYTESPVISLETYLAEIRKLSDRTGIKTVFISTDSDEVIEAFEVIKFFSIQQNIEFIWDRDEVRYNNANHRLVRENPQLKKQETLTAIKVLSLLESCDYLIGQVNVHFVLQPTYLKYARTGKNCTTFLFLNQIQFQEFKEFFGSKADTEMNYQIANSVMKT